MSPLERQLHPALLRWELPTLMLMAWLAFISIPLSLGEIGISWDALNHHIYLGWTAQQPRFDRDFVAAGNQAFQFPYLYWPTYKLAISGFSGAAAGVVLATLHLITVPPVWMLARICLPGKTVYDVLMRFIAVLLAFMTGVVLSLFDSTSNDLMAAAPLVWALALALEPLRENRAPYLTPMRLTLASGLCAGVSVAFKLSNGPLAILLPALWFLHGRTVPKRLRLTVAGSLATGVGFILTYGYWGWLLWNEFGNPIYPFHEHWFAPLRQHIGWQQ